MDSKIYIKNKRASFDYELLDKYTAGIVLVGTEIKSIRMGKASLVDSYCYFDKGELWIRSMNITAYFYGSYNNHNPQRDRKLLLSKKELRKLERGVKDPGVSIIPTALFINEKGLAKVNIALAKGKKEYDKRQSIKENEDKRKMAQASQHSY
ncbi:MAG: SsrA-binding protein SmpB [Paludibacteraceae bacterium]|nr:SsrA-binding protein SmpB [Paludibacteraceae bacterium]HPG55111.1 SsrA-binding protein SmpB [Candidatus Enterocola sp.]